MPVIPNPGGSVNPNQGMIDQSTFQTNDIVPGQDGVKGHVPAPPTGTPADYVLRADTTWGQGGTNNVLIPAMAFTGSAAGGTGQVFTNSNLRQYALAQDVDLTVNRTNNLWGNPLYNDFTLDNIAGSITVNFNLPANALLFIQSKVVQGAILTYYYLNENGIDRFLTEDGIDILRLETP